MEETQESIFKPENKKDHVKPLWQDAMELGDFISYAPSYQAGKYFTYFEKGVFPCASVGDMTYYWYDPVKHGKDPKKQYPLLVFFHGATNSLDGELCINYCGGELFASEEYQESMGGGAYMLIPIANEKRLPSGDVIGGWGEEYIEPCMELIQQMKKKENEHISKTILFGNSSGGAFVWMMLLHNPDIFDGLVPMGAGYALTDEQIEMLKTKDIHFLIVHGRRDEVVSFDKFLSPVETSLQNLKQCICYFPEWVRNSDGGVASINFGFEMGQHCIVNSVQSNLIFDNGKCYDERLPEGVTGWIHSIL